MHLFFRYILLGIEHVLPLGYDHVLFIVALFLLNSRLKTAVIQCTLFTIAHSITLALATFDFIHIPLQVIETAIAFSIALVAIENLFIPTLNYLRMSLVFVFGLLHGLGFSSALNEIGIPKSELLTSLCGFNLGVEIAQLFIILICYFTLAYFWKKKEWYQEKLIHPINMMIACIAMVIGIQRLIN